MRALCALTIIGAMFCGGAAADDSKIYKVKAAYLYKFLKATTWPDSKHAASDSPLVLAILGKDPFGKLIDTILDGKTIGGRPLEIGRIKKLDGTETSAHLLFVCESEKGDTADVVSAVAGSNVLTIGDFKGFAKDGGVLDFAEVDGKLRFEYSAKAAKEADLNLNANLVAAAIAVD